MKVLATETASYAEPAFAVVRLTHRELCILHRAAEGHVVDRDTPGKPNLSKVIAEFDYALDTWADLQAASPSLLNAAHKLGHWDFALTRTAVDALSILAGRAYTTSHAWTDWSDAEAITRRLYDRLNKLWETLWASDSDHPAHLQREIDLYAKHGVKIA
jgi:hypothetical protein